MQLHVRNFVVVPGLVAPSARESSRNRENFHFHLVRYEYPAGARFLYTRMSFHGRDIERNLSLKFRTFHLLLVDDESATMPCSQGILGGLVGVETGMRSIAVKTEQTP